MKVIFKRIIFINLLVLVSMRCLGQAGGHLADSQLPTRWTSTVSAKNTFHNYPRPQLTRTNWKNLNGLWKYAITDDKAASFDKADGKILVPYPVESALSGVKRSLQPTQFLWYQRVIQKPALKQGERCLLHFGAVDWRATVYINGKEAGTHEGGYTAFTFDITDFLKAGKNDLVVKVYDPTDQGYQPHGKQVLNPANIYYTASSGIWQTVWLETVPRQYIESLTITPDIDKSVVNVVVNSASNANVELTVAGKTVKCISNSLITIPIKNTRLWSPDDPFLYDLAVTLGEDKVKSYFGMRKISIGKDDKGFDRIMLNNKYTYNLGTLDQGFWPDGLYTAPTDEALEFDIKAVKAMGFNTIRKHIKVEPARWYYYADKLGMMVWQDLVNPNQSLPEGAKQEFEKESAEIVKQLHNYPCITTWVLFNEKWGQYDQERLTKWLKTADSSRLVNGHSGEYLYVNGQLRSPSPNAYVGADMTDVHSYPNPRMPERQPAKAMVCGEFGGAGVPVQGHEWHDLGSWGYVQLSAAELENKYSALVDSLKQLETLGLSGSIYTQAFDVEEEENGLVTYDREIAKLPTYLIRDINAKIWPASASNLPNKQVKLAKPPKQVSYSDQLRQYFNGSTDSALLRNLVKVATVNNDQSIRKRTLDDYYKKTVCPLSKSNLLFFKEYIKSTTDACFNLFLNHRQTIDDILGPDEAEGTLNYLIDQDLVASKNKRILLKWDEIEREAREKFGQIGTESVTNSKLFTSWRNEDWQNMAAALPDWCRFKWYEKKWMPDYNVNWLSYVVFQHVSDKTVLKNALTLAEYCLKKEESGSNLDTYANILYKLGHYKEALAAEEKAVSLKPGDPEIQENYRKMKSGSPTWFVPADDKAKP